MKLLLASTAVYLGNYTGANKINRLFLEQMAQRGHECRAVAVNTQLLGNGQPVEHNEQGVVEVGRTVYSTIVQVANVDVHVVDVPHLGELPKLRAYLVDQIKTFNPDIVIVSSEDWGQFVLEAAVSAAPERVVYFAHTGMALPCGPDSLMPNPAGTRNLRKVAAIVGMSQYLSSYIATWSGAPTTTLYPPVYERKQYPRFGAYDGQYVTMINPCAVKGISILLELARRTPDIAFAAVPTWGATDADHAALSEVANITVLPKAPNVDDIFARTRVLVVPSLWNEAYGLVVVEAMLRGIPVIASDTGGLPEAKLGTEFVIPVQPITKYVFDESLSLAQDVPAQDVAPWEAALRSVLSDAETYARHANAAYEAANTFVAQLGFEAYEELFQTIAAQRANHAAAATASVQRVNGFSDNKRALLDLLKKDKQKEHQQADAGAIQAVPRDGRVFPVTFAQQRVWFLEQLAPDRALYTIPAALRLHGSLDESALQSALSALAERHEALRTVFPVEGGQPVQHILPAAPVPLPLRSLAHLAPAERERVAQEHIHRAAATPFDLVRGPLLRAELLQLDTDDHILLLCLHHLVADGWSIDILTREVAQAYAAARANEPLRLPPLPVQYADVAVWQRATLQGARLDAQLAFWKAHLADAPALLTLPTDRPRPAVQRSRGANAEWLLPVALTQAVERVSQQQGVTTFMTLFSAYVVLLARWSGQSDVVVGTPIANRTRREQEGLIGFFANTLALRVRVGEKTSVAELLQTVRGVALDAYAHQDVPFDLVVDALQPDRNLSFSPIFQTSFSVREDPLDDSFSYQGLRITPLETPTSSAKFDLMLTVTTRPGGAARVSFEYDTDLFDAETIRRMLQHYQTILHALVAAPQQPVATLSLLSPAERHQLLREFTNTARPYPNASVHRVFESWVARAPDAVALRYGDTSLSYAALNAQANQLARFLQEQGVTNGTPVALYLERTPRLVVALLAILKAGGAYVPLDPSYPAARITFMLEDTAAPLLLSSAALAATLPASASQAVCLEQLDDVLASYADNNLPHAGTAEDLAYIIYTSGSTGTPKGAMIPHRGINRLVINTNYIELTPDDVVAQASTYAFDAATFELWGALLNGAQLVLIPRDTLLSPFEFAEQLNTYGITTLFLTTAVFNQMARAQPRMFRSLRTVIFGGETCDPQCVREVLRSEPPASLINAYGPTETTTYATCYLIRELDDAATHVPIGRAIANDQTFVLDAHLEPVPIGVIGELYIGGAGVGLGYLNRPELTREKFVPHPWSDDPSARLYRTGDLVRYLPDGAIEYVARADQQVKIRGFRIELGEVETALAKHPALQHVCAIAREDTPGDKRLVAYFTTGADAEPPAVTHAELRAFLQGKLPDYMIPSVFVPLQALPITPNGKIDKKALPAPDARAETHEQFVAPRTPIEAALAAIWQSTLGVAQVGIHDNFFALGGDSIQSIQVLSRAREVGIVLSPKQIIQAQTLAELAAQVDTERVVEAEQGTVTGDVPLTPIQRWFFAQEQPSAQHFNQSMLLEVHRPLDPALLEIVASHLARHHDALRSRFVRTAAGWQQTVVDGEHGQICTCVDVADGATFETTVSAAADTVQASLDLLNGPLLRVTYFRHGDGGTGRLLFVIHHLVVDGISWRVLLEDFQTLYTQLLRGEPLALPAKTTSFQAWSRSLAEYARTASVGADAAYWGELGTATVAPLPTDTQGPNTAGSTRTVSTFLSDAETAALLRDVPAAYQTRINDVLLAALLRACAPWTGAPSLLVAMEGHGREAISDQVDVSRTVGWFTSMFPVLLACEQPAGDGATLLAVKQQLREVPQHGLSYGLLRYLSDNDDLRARLAAQPQPQISFNYLGQFDTDTSDAALLTPAPENAGADIGADLRRPYLIDVVGSVVGGCLQIAWVYSTNLHSETTIAALAHAFDAALRDLIAHCLVVTPAATPTSAELSLLVALASAGSQAPFFCVHPSDGTVYCYVELARTLAADRPFYAIQAPGIEGGGAPFTDFVAMARCYVEQIRRVQPRGPYHIGGWSMGGVLAYEMAQQLVAAGETVAQLAIFDAGPELSQHQRELVEQMNTVAAQMPTQFSYEGVQQLELGDQLEGLISDANASGVAFNLDDLTGTIMKVLSAHGQARIAYTPRAYPGSVTLFRADDQSFVTGANDEHAAPSSDPTLGWEALVSGPVTVYPVPGDHLTMLRKPHVGVLADGLRRALAAAL